MLGTRSSQLLTLQTEVAARSRTAVGAPDVPSGRRFAERCPNGRFPIRKRPLRVAPMNGRSWPIPAIGAQASRMTARGHNRRPFAHPSKPSALGSQADEIEAKAGIPIAGKLFPLKVRIFRPELGKSFPHGCPIARPPGPVSDVAPYHRDQNGTHRKICRNWDP